MKKNLCIRVGIVTFCVIAMIILYRVLYLARQNVNVVIPSVSLRSDIQNNEDYLKVWPCFDDETSLPLYRPESRARWFWLQQYHLSEYSARQAEYDSSLQKTIDNPSIRQIILMVMDQEALKLLYRNLFWDPDKKLLLCLLNRRICYRDAVDMINLRLRDRLVIMSNQDIYPVDGLDLVDATHLREHRILYAPARWEPITCNLTAEEAAIKKIPYCSCHVSGGARGGARGDCIDTFLFYAPLQITSEDTKKYLDYNYGGNVLGGENRFMHIMNDRGYTVSNPCRSIHVYHNHCSTIRPQYATALQLPDTFFAGPAGTLDKVYTWTT